MTTPDPRLAAARLLAAAAERQAAYAATRAAWRAALRTSAAHGTGMARPDCPVSRPVAAPERAEAQ